MAERIVAERYRLLERIGSGLWRAEDMELERDVALRLLAPEEPASVAVQLAHPNIVRVFEQGESGGERFEVQEYVPGESLAQRLARAPLSEEAAQQVAQDLTDAIAYAHAQGIAHGSLGPDSVLLDADGRAKVTGFGGGESQEADARALADLQQLLGSAVSPSEPATEIVRPPLPTRRSRRALVLAAVALLLAAAGVGAALLASADDGGDSPASSARVVPISTRTGDTAATTAPAPTTTSDRTTTATTAATTTAPEPTEPPTTATLPLPTEPLPTIEPPPTTTEEVPPPTTEGITTTIEVP